MMASKRGVVALRLAATANGSSWCKLLRGASRYTPPLTLRHLAVGAPARYLRCSYARLAAGSTTPPSATSSSPGIVQFNLADIGEGITECELLQWFVKEGATIAQFDRICEVQSDKATVEITSRYDGTVVKLHYAAGATAKVGAPLVDIQTVGGGDDDDNVSTVPSPSAPAAQEAPKPSTAQLLNTVAAVSTGDTEKAAVYTTPAVRRIAREMQVNLESVRGTGKAGRITKEDVLNYCEARSSGGAGTAPPAPLPASAASSTQRTTVVPLSPVQKAMVKTMQRSLQIPHFGFSDQLNVAEVRQMRAAINRHLKETAAAKDEIIDIDKISMMPILIKAFSTALLRFPLLNAQFVAAASDTSATPAQLLYRADHNIAIAMDTPSGLLVPNIPRVQEKSVLQIAGDLQRLQRQAQSGTLPPAAFSNPTITISNIGNIGGTVLHPVIPADTVCIAALGRAQTVPRLSRDVNGTTTSTLGAVGGGWSVVEDELMQVSFSADHRVVDGATVARFFAEWKRLLEQPGLFLLQLK